MARSSFSPQVSRKNFRSSGVRVLKKTSAKNDVALAKEIADRALKRYKRPAKDKQTEAVLNLVRGKNVFLLAGTGFGKSRIPEMYYQILPKQTGAVVLVLNPLDSLGDNQVTEKVAAGFTAINLTKLTFNPEEAGKIKEGTYQFVYLSPEIFMNSKLWDSVYFSSEFQNRLALVVADEAHMIYQWGIVESTKGIKSGSALNRHEDRGCFRPSYGRLGIHLLAREEVPLLLMSATCRPVAVKAIQKSLKLDQSNMVMLKAELTRPEIRIIRSTMKYSLSSSNDLLSIFPPESLTPDDKLVPTLIYSGSRRRTGQVLDVLAAARHSPELQRSATSMLARRYHSCTGDSDKIRCINDFAADKFPIFSSTMALGLGQNWSRVRSVIHMGRGEPSAICQMIGRCGRDGRPGLAILFVEKTRKNGKNNISQFGGWTGGEQSEDDRMDALAITPVCLRIALAIDNKWGYIPLSFQDSGYVEEKQREEKVGFAQCRCSNCMPEDSEALMRNIQYMTRENMDDMVLHGLHGDHPELLVKNKPVATRKQPDKYPIPSANLISFRKSLLHEATGFLSQKLTEDSFLSPYEIFNNIQVDAIIKHIKDIGDEESVRRIIGGSFVRGHAANVMQIVSEFKAGPIYKGHMEWAHKREEDDWIIKTANYKLTDEQKTRKPIVKAQREAEKAEQERQSLLKRTQTDEGEASPRKK
ncbi:ATP-dependent DNA helicase sgs1 [Puccinia graminis f. sp. tritici]|uniref:DNA 3'-5' helicase n=1 Tax=Puccinia graminis f. sp. tritici TaxID=56615 RepID=A0A5B0PPG2_PUCGR|nr:ATP-dependent DNA helicase sgs1 [Puccinia graminis f. sp. tritici]